MSSANAKPTVGTHDFEQIEHIVNTLDHLRKSSSGIGNEELNLIITSAFNMCMCAYYMALRIEAMDKVIPIHFGTTHNTQV